MIPIAEKRRLVSLIQFYQTGSVAMSMWKKMLGGVTRENEAAASSGTVDGSELFRTRERMRINDY